MQANTSHTVSSERRVAFVLNVPAFYKIALLNELARVIHVKAFFLGTTDQVILRDEDIRFDYTFISKSDMDVKHKGVRRGIRLLKMLRKETFDYIVWSGWDNIENFLGVLAIPRAKNLLISESSIFESTTVGLKGRIKRWFLRRISTVFASGAPHKELLQALGYTGEIITVGSVGVTQRSERTANQEIHNPVRYIYVGRLIELKNLRLLVEVCTRTSRPLTIVGKGPLESLLRKMAGTSVLFTGFVPNNELDKVLEQADCLVLPSKSEPWGLVVEEALEAELAVIASDKVGSAPDLVTRYDAGVVFRYDSAESLEEAMRTVERDIATYKRNARSIDFRARQQVYIDAFVKRLSS